MARGFVTGVLWGCVVMGAGLTVLSQIALPVPEKRDVVVVGVTPAAKVVPPDSGEADAGAAPDASKAEAAKPVVALDEGVTAGAKPMLPKDGDVAVAAIPALPTETAVPAVPKADEGIVATSNVGAVATVAPDVAVSPDLGAAAKVATVEPVAPPEAGTTAPVVSDTAVKIDTAAMPSVEEAAPIVVKPAVNANPALGTASADAGPALASPDGPKPDAPVLDVGGVLAFVAPAVPLPDVPAVPEAPPTLAGLEPALTAPGAEIAPVAPLPPEPEGAKDALLAPALQPGQVDPARLPQIAPADDPGLTAVAPAVVPAPEAELPPKESAPTTIEAQVPTLPPVKGLVDRVPTGLGDVPGVEVNNLPHIGGVPKVEVAVDDERPVDRFARSFDGAASKPLFVILLHDVGSAGMSRDELATLPFPVSFVIDPLATDATAASAAYRSAGQEVVTLANGIPAGAQASDLAETFQTLAGILPESVAVIDQDLGGFQDNRLMASMVLPILQDEGRGLVTYDRGLNAADQIARRDGVPAAVIFRRLDGEGESKSTIRRYLDRAAFKAAQEGAVVVIGDTRAETVAAILEWTVEGRASAVTLAPLTAVLGRK